MSVYTCITCRVAFADAELQRAHYKTDWHRYNLKRKVAEMPPVTAENFQQRVLTQRSQIADEERDTARNCLICGKHFSTQNAFDNHIKSKKHKELESKQEKQLDERIKELNAKNVEKGLDRTDLHDKDSVNQALKESLQGQEEEEMDDDNDDDSGADSWEEDMLGIEECLFCSHISESFETNMSHMTTQHSFFIPDLEFVVDMEGLITYLGEKVGIGHVCLWCNEKGKQFHNRQAVQRHMVDKGHCKMLHEGDVLLEYTDFYDYRSSYPEGDSEGATGGAAAAAGGGDDDMGEEVETETLISDGFELVLPSGATIGHRSLAKYYRQNVPPERKETRSIVPRMLAQYKALGWTGATGVLAQKRVKDLGFMQRLKQRHFMKVGYKANNLQHHFRSQNPI